MASTLAKTGPKSKLVCSVHGPAHKYCEWTNIINTELQRNLPHRKWKCACGKWTWKLEIKK